MRAIFLRLEAEGYPREAQVRRAPSSILLQRYPAATATRNCLQPARHRRIHPTPHTPAYSHTRPPPHPHAITIPPQTLNANAAPQAVWRQHWDFQLAKALEVQFRLGLASITKSLPEVGPPLDCSSCCQAWAPDFSMVAYAKHDELSSILLLIAILSAGLGLGTRRVTQVEVRVVLRGGRPCLDPPVEELRLRHYREHLGAFLGLPAKMKVRGPACFVPQQAPWQVVL